MANVSLTSYASQLAEIDRQKRLANLLQTQAQEPIEIQSYKGTQAAIPLTSVLAKLLNQVGGQMKEARAIKREGELSAKDREVAQNLIGGRVSTAKISDIPQPRSLGVAMGELPQGPTPESRFMQQAQAAPMGEMPQGPTPESRFMQRPGLTPEAQFMQRAAPQAIPSPGAMMNIPPQGVPMGMPPSAPPMGGPLRPPLPMMNIPSQATDRARTPTEQIEAGQRALLDPTSGPLATAMAERVILRGERKIDAADARALMLEDEERKIKQANTLRDDEAARMKTLFGGEPPPGTSQTAWNAALASGDSGEISKLAQKAYENANTPAKLTDDMIEYQALVAAGELPDGQFGRFLVDQANRKRPSNTTNVSVNAGGESAYTRTVSEGLGKQDIDAISAGRSAPVAIASAQRVKEILDSGVPITGTAAEFQLAFAKAFNPNNPRVADTQELIADLANVTLSNISTSGLGTGQGFTTGDRIYLEKAKAGNISFTAESLRRIANITENVARESIKTGNAALDRIQQSPSFRGATSLPGLVEVPPEYKRPAPGGPLSPAEEAERKALRDRLNPPRR